MDTLGKLVKDVLTGATAGANVELVIMDNETMDYLPATLTKVDMLRVLGKALYIGYTMFEVFLTDTNVLVMKVDESGIHLNTEIFGE